MGQLVAGSTVLVEPKTVISVTATPAAAGDSATNSSAIESNSCRHVRTIQEIPSTDGGEDGKLLHNAQATARDVPRLVAARDRHQDPIFDKGCMWPERQHEAAPAGLAASSEPPQKTLGKAPSPLRRAVSAGIAKVTFLLASIVLLVQNCRLAPSMVRARCAWSNRNCLSLCCRKSWVRQAWGEDEASDRKRRPSCDVIRSAASLTQVQTSKLTQVLPYSDDTLPSTSSEKQGVFATPLPNTIPVDVPLQQTPSECDSNISVIDLVTSSVPHPPDLSFSGECKSLIPPQPPGSDAIKVEANDLQKDEKKYAWCVPAGADNHAGSTRSHSFQACNPTPAVCKPPRAGDLDTRASDSGEPLAGRSETSRKSSPSARMRLSESARFAQGARTHTSGRKEAQRCCGAEPACSPVGAARGSQKASNFFSDKTFPPATSSAQTVGPWWGRFGAPGMPFAPSMQDPRRHAQGPLRQAPVREQMPPREHGQSGIPSTATSATPRPFPKRLPQVPKRLPQVPPPQPPPFSEDAVMVELEARLKELCCSTPDDQRRGMKELLVQWHPDKNPDRREEATRIFQWLQSRRNLLRA